MAGGGGSTPGNDSTSYRKDGNVLYRFSDLFRYILERKVALAVFYQQYPYTDYDNTLTLFISKPLRTGVTQEVRCQGDGGNQSINLINLSSPVVNSVQFPIFRWLLLLFI